MKLLLLHLAFVMSMSANARMQHPDFSITNGLTYDITSGLLDKSGADSWKNGSAISNNSLSFGNNGIIEYAIESINDTKAFGLVNSLATKINGLSDLDFSFYISKTVLYLTQNGTVKGRFGKVKTGTKLSIEIQNGSIMFLMNGKTLKVMPVPANTDYSIGALIYNQGGQFSGIQTSFPLPPPPPEENLSIQYTKLTDQPTGYVKEVGNQYYFSFEHKLLNLNDELEFYIWNKFHKDKSEDAILSSYQLINGLNRFHLNLTSLEVGYYTIEVMMPNGDRHFGKFQKLTLAAEEEDGNNNSTTN